MIKGLICSALATGLACLLTSCMNTAVSGAQAVYDRHSLKKSIDDHATSLRATQAIYVKTDRFNDTHVSIDTFNGVILLTGQVPEAGERIAIENIVRRLALTHPVELHNEIVVTPPSSTLTRASDTWITTKITAQLIASEEVSPSQIKVITENGTVYLMGVVSRDEGNTAIEIARNTDGVQDVVKVLSWITISKS